MSQAPDFLNANNKTLIQLIKNLGPGVLRIGGDSSDQTYWGGNEHDSATSKDSITTSDIDRLSAFSKAIGWHVLFGLNLRNNDAKAAAHEAHYVHKSLKENLFAFQSGNEPDVFYINSDKPKYNFADYHQDWKSYYEAVNKAVHHAPFAGPDITPYNPGWLTSFMKVERSSVKLLDAHYYVTGPASNPLISCHDILYTKRHLARYLDQLNKVSADYNIPFRISECNSVSGKGKPGVSDTFASALWALDFMWTVAEYNGQGVNFHGGGSTFVYSPVGSDNNIFSAKPMYYAMLAFKYSAVGSTVIPAIAIDKADNNCSAHASANADGTYTVTLINKETAKNFSFVVQLSNQASSINVARLSAPSITATHGTTFAGSSVNSDGTFAPSATDQYAVNQKTFVVKVPAGSAAIVTIQ